MDSLILFTKTKIERLISKRPLESKFGEHVKVLSTTTNIYEDLERLDVKYIILGLPEDVGVFANYGKQGARNAFDATIKVLLNTQNNQFNHANEVLILGHLDFSAELKALSNWKQSNTKHIEKARKLVENIDKEVSNAVNNAYGNIKGTSLALSHKINAINFDAHTDYRALEGRHSGNGFSYAFAEGFLNKYFMFGLHENYTSASILKTLDSKKHLKYNTYEALAIREQLVFKKELKRALKFVSNKPFGIEIDCDAIVNV